MAATQTVYSLAARLVNRPMDTAVLVAQRLHQLNIHLTHSILTSIPAFWPFAFMTASGDTDEPSFFTARITEHIGHGTAHHIYYTLSRINLRTGFTECRFAIEDDRRTHFEITAQVYKDRYVLPLGLGDIYIRALRRAGWLKSPWAWMV